ncbi:secreted protein, partial [methanotrophic bacterial endosymbiont of Bathymodiolus sp.]
MKTKIHAALLALLLVVALPTASSEPLYAKSLDDEGVSLRVKSAAAVTRSQNELAAIAKSIIRPAAKADLDSTQTLYHVVNDLRYKA